MFFFFLTGIVAENIEYYEFVDYNVTNVHKQHLDAINLQRNPVVTISFIALKRYIEVFNKLK